MIEIDVDEFEPDIHLEEAARRGEVIWLTMFGRPVAEVKPLPGILEPRPPVPPPGAAVGQGQILPGAFDPWEDDAPDPPEGKKG
jgi:antitoxin (DNA-binding transcriptional repressor) of toxin-antitoxin stability system